MSDRGSAHLFGRVFELIDEHVPPQKQAATVKRFWEMSFEYDFAPEDMHCDPALKRLGYAKEVPNPDYPEDGPITVYKYGREWR